MVTYLVAAAPHCGLFCLTHNSVFPIFNTSKSEFLSFEHLARVASSVIPAKAGIQNCLKNLDSRSRFACPEDNFPLG